MEIKMSAPYKRISYKTQYPGGLSGDNPIADHNEAI